MHLHYCKSCGLFSGFKRQVVTIRSHSVLLILMRKSFQRSLGMSHESTVSSCVFDQLFSSSQGHGANDIIRCSQVILQHLYVMVQVHHPHRDLGIVFNTLISHQSATFHVFSETIILTPKSAAHKTTWFKSFR